MIRRRIFIRELLDDIYLLGIIHSFFCAILLLTGGSMAFVLHAALLFVFILLMRFVRYRAHSLVLFFLLHVLLAATPLLLPFFSTTERVLAIIGLAAAAIYSISARFRENSPIGIGRIAFGAVALISLDIVLAHYASQSLMTLFIFWIFVFLVCCLLSSQTYFVDESLSILSGSAQQPLRVILRFSNILLAVFGILMISAASLALFFPLGTILRTAGSLLLSAIRWISGFFPEHYEQPIPEPEPPPPSPPRDNMLLPEGVPPPGWFAILLDTLFILIFIAIVIAFLCSVVYALYRLYLHFHKQQSQDGDVREYIGPLLEKEQLTGFLKSVRTRIPLGAGTEAARVRRIYAKKVRAQIKRGAPVTTSDTTGEIYKKLPRRETMDELTECYNKVRYGQDNSHL